MTKHIIIGTAGHVDHGKTTLIQALTGHDTDRLREEKERGISIELGFAPFDLPSGRRAGVVDVPGHERFIKHMLAGVGGFDLVLLVVAADEGVMPQTKEHLDILQLSGVKNGLIVLTKADLVDEEWLELVEDDVRLAVQATFLAEAPIYWVSALTKHGVAELLQAIDKATDAVAEREIGGPFRLPVDRVFTIPGFGTVITGTLISGTVQVGDQVLVYPGRLEARVRQLEVHDQRSAQAVAGQRVALNLAGLGIEDVERGAVVATPGSLTPSALVDVRLLILASTKNPVEHQQRVRVHTGAAEILGRVCLLEGDEIRPGESALVQLRLEQDLAVRRGDRFVIRSYSPATTIGGGIVLEPAATRHKRRDEKVLIQLRQKEKGAPEDLVAQALTAAGMALQTAPKLARAAGVSLEQAETALAILESDNEVISIMVEGNKYYLGRELLLQTAERARAALTAYHKRYPLRVGAALEEVRARFFPQVSARFLVPLLSLNLVEDLTIKGDRIRLANHKVKLTPEQEKAAQILITALEAQPFSPPAPSEIIDKHDLGVDAKELITFLLDSGQLIQLAADIVLTAAAYQQAGHKVIAFIKENSSITVAEVRDLLGTSRRYAVPLLEHLDANRVTRRVGDKRILGPAWLALFPCQATAGRIKCN
ncbi:MAG TPA: selenocysteine-specific translation elongation factor [bacterium]|nr:selenocysteine-specific translation elongation factor [bacterium]